ncbi:substrate-binding periplasmic protein [Legionella oakridgensis]|uniref:substrate-binding periplasmic protein n=1 Tax=Legionella oakridgensis TaxID=29423 RepID=UPI0003DE28F5|nr:ABC transporter substrate-binding protein [Legionella oakridgensis]ETO93359.1 amino acid ABC transporter substrate-binding protein, PAAT family [Legionella oakridgensis RV-2-2007]
MQRFILIFVCSLLLIISGCYKEKNKSNELRFSTAAEYPPFEYIEHGNMKGFDIDLAQLIAKELGKKAIFDDLQFSTVLTAVASGQDDAAIATITITNDRKKNFDFSRPYYFESMVAVFKHQAPIKNQQQLAGKKVAAQLGSVMDIWLHQHIASADIITFDSNNQAIEALMSGHVDAVVVDGAQGRAFSQKYPELSYHVLAKADDGYGIALQKNSPLTKQINQALANLIKRGDISKLKKKWLEDNSWMN